MDYLQTKGRIFDIQRYSVHDGPGIRTIVFLKGCVLRCRWCCNPESQEYKIQTMKVLGEDKVIGRDVTVEEMIKVVEEDRPYYRRSGGGLTLSGGESLCQPEFARDLLRAAKEHGINTALESMACAPFETIEYHISSGIFPEIQRTDIQISRLLMCHSRRIAIVIGMEQEKLTFRIDITGIAFFLCLEGTSRRFRT